MTPKALRICHVMSADLWAGAEVQLATTAAYLVEQPDITMSAVLFNDGPLATELRRLGVSVTVVDEQKTGALGIVRFLTRFLSEHPVDVVHTHRYKDTVLGAVAAKRAGVPYVVRTVHGLHEPMGGWRDMKLRAYESLEKAVLQVKGDLVIAVSSPMADTLRASGYRPTMVTHVPNGVDLEKVKTKRGPADIRRELGVDSQALLIGTVGRLERVKGHLVLLQAAGHVLEKRPDARFLIVGSGPLAGELVASAERLGIGSACLFAGPRTDVYDVMAAMDVFVLPSLNEGIPMALLEAMALATPVVATAVGGVPEVIHHGATGRLVPPGDERALAAACLELASDREAALALGRQGRLTVEREFSHAQSGRALVDAYRSVTLIPKVRRTRRATVGPLDLCWGLARKLVEYGARKFVHAVVRCRMHLIRRHPETVKAVLRRARSVLVVCHGNIIRSPFAAHLLRQALGPAPPVSISSAGLEAIPGRPPHPTAIDVAGALQMDLSSHTARPLGPDAVAQSDAIFVMDIPQLVQLRRRFPEAGNRTFLLTSLAPATPLEIRDPVDGDAAVFQECFNHISRAATPIAGVIAKSAAGR